MKIKKQIIYAYIFIYLTILESMRNVYHPHPNTLYR